MLSGSDKLMQCLPNETPMLVYSPAEGNLFAFLGADRGCEQELSQIVFDLQ